jgi:hypothetical protein
MSERVKLSDIVETRDCQSDLSRHSFDCHTGSTPAG